MEGAARIFIPGAGDDVRRLQFIPSENLSVMQEPDPETIWRLKRYFQVSREERLNRQELERLKDIQSLLQELRKDVDALIADYRARTGNK